MSIHEHWMRRCLTLAKRGLPDVRKNPLVGSCIVVNNQIIGEGYHESFGGPHAEINALMNVDESDRTWIPRSTLYVNLEPCNHQGKTPPCSTRLIEEGIKHVVIGQVDPNPQASGGIARMRAAGIKIESGILAYDCQQLNRGFKIGLEQNRPYITIKWAESKDGFMGVSGQRVVISNSMSHTFAHNLRRKNNAIMVGAGTIRSDNPSLTTRLVHGNNALRVVVLGNDEMPASSKVLIDRYPTLVFCPMSANLLTTGKKIIHPFADEQMDVKDLVQILYRQYDVGYLLVEGGLNLIQQFLDANLWDVIYRIKAPIQLSKGVRAPVLDSIAKESMALGDNQIDCFEG